MKRSLFIALAATLYLLVSCMAEIDQTVNDAQSSAHGPNVVFQALTEGPASPETKVYADENMKVLWNAADRETFRGRLFEYSAHIIRNRDRETFFKRHWRNHEPEIRVVI